MAIDKDNKKDLIGYLNKNFLVYPSKYLFKKDSEHVLVWSGTDVYKFLDFAKSLDKRVIYTYTPLHPENENPETPESTEPAAVGFIIEGFLNVFLIDQDLSQAIGHEISSAPSVSDEHKLGVSELIAQDPDKLAKEMANFVKANLDYMSPDPFNLAYFFKKFWESKGVREEQSDRNFKAFKEKIELKATGIIKS
ncbi:MAG: hypothetical protein LVQ96_07210 [Thermoplasmatales archaeon]|nr:hypothetical protein [Thermoplasmatales archaeon]MCW6170944.1 hypothetical protein [Thermoplasmatales archaeon]